MRSHRLRHLSLLAASAAVLLAGCIERAPTPRSRRASFKRSGLSEIVSNAAPSAARRVGAVFGDAVELVGVDHSPARPKPGDTVEVSFYFRVNAEADEDYKVFVHAEGAQSQRINGDHWPAGGRYPTGVWQRGEVVRDRWTLKIPSHFTGDAIELWTGFYQPGKEDRWPLTNRAQVQNDGQNRVLAATLRLQ